MGCLHLLLICQVVWLHRLLPVHFLELLVNDRGRLREQEPLRILKFLLIGDCVFHGRQGGGVLVDEDFGFRDLLRLFLVYLYFLVFRDVVFEIVEEV